MNIGGIFSMNFIFAQKFLGLSARMLQKMIHRNFQSEIPYRRTFELLRGIV